MPTIQDTIIKATKEKGAEILKNKMVLSVVIEDLSPALKDEREFINRVYNDDVGKILYEAFIAGSVEKKSALIREADRFLDEENGRNSKWREKLLSYFSSTIMRDSADISVNDTSPQYQEQKIDIPSISPRSMKNAAVVPAALSSDSTLEEIKKQNQREALIEMERGKKSEEKNQLEEAFFHYKKAAELGDAKGAYLVGFMYECGKGVQKNLESAEEWYKKAAERGSGGAHFRRLLLWADTL